MTVNQTVEWRPQAVGKSEMCSVCRKPQNLSKDPNREVVRAAVTVMETQVCLSRVGHTSCKIEFSPVIFSLSLLLFLSVSVFLFWSGNLYALSLYISSTQLSFPIVTEAQTSDTVSLRGDFLLRNIISARSVDILEASIAGLSAFFHSKMCIGLLEGQGQCFGLDLEPYPKDSHVQRWGILKWQDCGVTVALLDACTGRFSCRMWCWQSRRVIKGRPLGMGPHRKHGSVERVLHSWGQVLVWCLFISWLLLTLANSMHSMHFVSSKKSSEILSSIFISLNLKG